MAWIIPKYSKSMVDRAGIILRDYRGEIPEGECLPALEIIGNYRSSHGFALNNYQNIMRGIAARCGGHYLLAQRLKRMPSIMNKLIDRHGQRLTQIQDIGGCRVVLRDIQAINRVVSQVKRGRLSSKLIENLSDDYIQRPKDDGYRCIHLVFRYVKNIGNSPYNNQKIEVQVRTQLQHSWATALESVDIFKRYKLKRGRGPSDWKEFFALVSSAFAEREGTARLSSHDSLSRGDIIDRIRSLMESIKVVDALTKYKSIVETIDRLPSERGGKKYGFILVRLNLSSNKLMMTGYKPNQFEMANDHYMKAEEAAIRNQQDEVALVATDRISELKKAYPNYYMDTNHFMSSLLELLG